MNYSISVNQISKKDWEQLLPEFDDASIYQTWSYGAVRWGESNISHVVIEKKGAIIAAAQLRIIKMPFLKAGIAYLPWGPMWRRRDRTPDINILRIIINVLREEFALRKGLLLRIAPNLTETNDKPVSSVFQDAGFKIKNNVEPYRTLLLDLSPELTDIRKSFDRRWRNHLNRAEKNNLEITEGSSDELYGIFLSLQKEMHDRKKYIAGVDYAEFRDIQNDLPPHLKMIILICEHNGKALAATIGSLIGDTGIYLLGATGNEGMNMKGAYLLQWRLIEIMKERKCRFYDLGGIDPENNPGVYHFKSGVSRKESSLIGQFEISQSKFSRLIVDNAEELKSLQTQLHKHLQDKIIMNFGKR